MSDEIKVGHWIKVGRAPGGNVVIVSADNRIGAEGVVIERADVPDLIRALIKLQDKLHRVEFVEAKQ